MKCLEFYLRGREVGRTSVFSWFRSILLKWCLFWAQTQNTSVSDGLGKQINKWLDIDCSLMFVYEPYVPSVPSKQVKQNSSNQFPFSFCLFKEKKVLVFIGKVEL